MQTCQICKTKITAAAAQFCDNCGWEFVAVADTASDALKQYVAEKERRYRQIFNAAKEAQAKIETLEQKAASYEQAAMAYEQAAAALKGSVRLPKPVALALIIPDEHYPELIPLLQEGSYSFGNGYVKTESERHVIIKSGSTDRRMEKLHFLIDLKYNGLQSGKRFECQFKAVSRNTEIDAKPAGTTGVWQELQADACITAGATKILLTEFPTELQ